MPIIIILLLIGLIVLLRLYAIKAKVQENIALTCPTCHNQLKERNATAYCMNCKKYVYTKESHNA